MNKNCTIYRTVNFIGKRWTLLLLLELYKGRSKWKRYSEIKSKMQAITPKMLSSRLKELKKEGLVDKKVDSSTFPIKCEYSLTKKGSDFVAVLKSIKKWGIDWKVNNKSCNDSECRDCKF